MNFTASALKTNASARPNVTVPYTPQKRIELLQKENDALRELLRSEEHQNRQHVFEAERLQRVIDDLHRQNSAQAMEIAVLNARPVHEDTGFMLNGRSVMAMVSHQREITMAALTGTSRSSSIVTVRQEAMYEVARRCPWLSLPEIARLFYRDHTTVLHALREWPKKAKKLGIPVHPLGRERSGDA